jgi:hypothetical protein
MPDLTDRMLARTPPDAVLVGIDEETALVSSGNGFTARGNNSVWRIDRDGTRLQLKAGEQLEFSRTAPQ